MKLISKSKAANIYLDWIDAGKIENVFGSNIPGSPQAYWDEFLIGEFQPYVPMETGMLIRSATLATTIGSGEIIYSTPYARFLYYGKVMVDPVTGSAYARRGTSKVVINQGITYSTAANPKAGPFWDRRAQSDRGDAWVKFYKGIILKELGGS
jgi:hypothetical protein